MPRIFRLFLLAPIASLAACGGETVTPVDPDPDPDDLTARILTTAIPLGVQGTDFEESLFAVGGDGAFSWSLTSGALPTGVSLTSDGMLRGVADEFGSFDFQVRVVSGGATDSASLTLSIVETRRVSAGAAHTCAVRGMDAYCWGLNDWGELGSAGPGEEPEPVAVPGLQRFASIAAGGPHSCGLRDTGQAVCWGANLAGQLGTGSANERQPPADVVGEHRFLTISAWKEHTCGLDLIGAIYCWGLGRNGQIGIGANPFWQTTPIRVVSGERFVDVAVGQAHSCGIADDGRTYCWGENVHGQLGNGSFGSETLPVLVGGTQEFVDIVAGFSHTCALDTDGRAYCWGSDLYGQLGTGSVGGDSRSEPVLVSESLRFTRLSAGSGHTCGLDLDGRAWCWGLNGNGQAGTGSEEAYVPQPTQVAAAQSFVEVASNYGHTCALTEHDEVYCWGWNANGRLGDGTLTDRRVPTGPVLLP